MCVLSDTTILAMGLENFVQPADPELLNPASIDIRIGKQLMWMSPAAGRSGKWQKIELKEGSAYWLNPGELVLVETYEKLLVPDGHAMEMKLKSSIARQGYDHSLAFWFDPGWEGIGTMEISNHMDYVLPLEYGMRFAQIIYHRLTEPATHPYEGRYQHATGVESAKP